MNNSRKQLFLSLPLPLKKLAINTVAMQENRQRYGRAFNAYKEQFHAQKDQENRDFRSLIVRVAQDHPFYREYSIKTFDDIPIVSKEDIMENYDRFLIDKNQVLRKPATSGTTGRRFEFAISRNMLQKKFASAWFFRELHGLYREERQANFFGRAIFKPDRDRPPFWLFSRPTNQLLFSELHLTRERAPLYLEQLIKHRVRWFHGFPSFVSLFAGYILENGMMDQARAMNLKGITLSSENLMTHQRNLIQKVFGCKVINFYSQGEGVADIYEDTDGLLKVNQMFSHVEFIPRDDGLFRIVGTQLDNQCMPFIRYDTGDLAELDENPTLSAVPKIKTIIGRKSEFLMLKNGRKVFRLGQIFTLCEGVKEAQIHQDEPGKALFLINPTSNFQEESKLSLERIIKNKLGHDFQFDIKIVDSISKTGSGKLRLIRSSLS